MTTDPEFFQMVRVMRRFQKEFFRLRPEDRPPGLIRQAKAAEAMVDRAIAEATAGQGMLFAADDRSNE